MLNQVGAVYTSNRTDTDISKDISFNNHIPKVVTILSDSTFSPEEGYTKICLKSKKSINGTKEIIFLAGYTPDVLKRAGYKLANPIQAAFYLAIKQWFSQTPFSISD